jgi:DNA polymerase III delta subunit
MLTIIHGNDIVTSRKFFLSEKQRFPEALIIREDEVDLTMLAQLLEGGGLFEDTKTIFIEQFLSTRKKSLDKESVIAYLVKQAKTHSIFLWEGKELERTAINPFKDSKVSLYKLPSTLFTLLDAIKPGGGNNLIKLFHSCLETTEVEMIFFMLVRQFRLLLAVSEKQDPAISEIARMSSWQKSKLQNQAKLFPGPTLIDLYNCLFQIETQYKTGNLCASLTAEIDFFLLKI